MVEFFRRLFDTRGFLPRRECGDWTAELVTLHVVSDLLIWLAYISIPLMLVWYTHRWNVRAVRLIGFLFAAFILSCGFTHLLDAMMFYYPAYRINGLVRLVTAVVSWATVIALVPLVPQVLALFESKPGELVRPRQAERTSWQGYAVAVALAAAALLLRAVCDPVLETRHAFMFPFLAVMIVGWMDGFGPALVTLGLSFLGMTYLFVEPRGQMWVRDFRDQFDVILHLFGGFACAVLASSERLNRIRAAGSLQQALRQRDVLETEVRLRREVEAQLVQRQGDLAAARAAADEALTMYRTLAEAMPQMVWVTGPAGANEYLNRRWQDYTGLSAEQCLRGEWARHLHPDDVAAADDRWQRSLASGEAYEIEFRLRSRDGEYRWFLARAVPARNAAGQIVRWFGTCTDIHDSTRLQEDLRQSLSRFRSLTEAVPQKVWTADATGVVNYFNRRWHEFTGFQMEQMSWPDGVPVIHADDVGRLSAAWRAAVKGAAEGFGCEFRLRRADGEFVWHLARALPLRTTDGQTLGWVGTLTDIHDQKERAAVLERVVGERTFALERQVEERTRAEARLQAVAVELQRSNRELEAFASVASHDLQEPVRKIMAFGDRLRHGPREQLDEQGRDYLDRIMGAAARMRKLIEDLLTYARVTTQAKPFTAVDLDAIMKDVLSDLEIRIAQTGARVEVAPLPRVEADPVQMRQLFQNLISNGLKFTAAGATPVVRVGTGPAQDGFVRLTFADEGIGFEPRYLDRIFQVFQRLHGRTEYEGTGIGLAICKKIADRHGGSITATSRPGHGATFIVELPIEHPKAREP